MLQEKWCISLLNGLAAQQGAQVIRRFRTQKTGELLAYLAVNLGRTVSREELADRTWPDSDIHAARGSLRTALRSLRQQLEPPGTAPNTVLYADRTSAGLHLGAVTSDVKEFEAACAREAVGTPRERAAAGLEALRLYTGDFLPGSYADWILAERERLRQVYVGLLRRVTTGLWERGDQEQALDLARRLIAVDPLCEDAYLQIMRLYSAAGRPTDALRCFQDWKRLLHDELGESPAPELVKLAAQIGVAGSTPAGSFELLPLEDSRRPSPPIAGSQERLAAPFAPPKTTAQPTVRLPLILTRFFGRETEMMDICHMLRPVAGLRGNGTDEPAQRLVTLTGPGGTGKTRLAVEAARRIAEKHSVGVAFVPLAEVDEPERILEAVAAALGVNCSSSADLLDSVISAIGSDPFLLVLDNFEQLLTPSYLESVLDNASDDAGVALLTALLACAPHLQCLVTSRQCLDIEGEREYPVRMLSTPVHAGTPERLVEFASVQLFLDRAQSSRPDFQLTTRNVDAVGALCTRLEGLPLAIELAAAWTSVLSPAQILERLSHRFDLLVSRRKGKLSRHQTLRAAIEWSYLLLPRELQQFFVRLAVFRGGWLAEAAEAVCDEPRALKYLRALRDRSLVTVEESRSQPVDSLRFHLLESIREFASEGLSVDDRLYAHRRHLQWFVEWSERVRPELSGASELYWLDVVGAELENIRAVLARCIFEPQAVQSGMRLMGNLSTYWLLRGNHAEIRSLLGSLFGARGGDAPTASRAACLNLAGRMDSYVGHWTDSKRFYKEEQEILQQLGLHSAMASGLIGLGRAAVNLGDYPLARDHFIDALARYESEGDEHGIATAYSALALLANMQEDYEAGAYYLKKTLATHRKRQAPSDITQCAATLGFTYCRMGLFEEARPLLAESLDGYCQLKDLVGLTAFYPRLFKHLPASEDALRLLAASAALRAPTGAPPVALDAERRRLQEALGPERFEAEWQRGAALTSEQAIELARFLIRESALTKLLKATTA